MLVWQNTISAPWHLVSECEAVQPFPLSGSEHGNCARVTHERAELADEAERAFASLPPRAPQATNGDRIVVLGHGTAAASERNWNANKRFFTSSSQSSSMLLLTYAGNETDMKVVCKLGIPLKTILCSGIYIMPYPHKMFQYFAVCNYVVMTEQAEFTCLCKFWIV